jgi:hypothetical protein
VQAAPKPSYAEPEGDSALDEDFDDEDFDDYEFVVVADAAALDQATADRLRDYVESGGGLLLALFGLARRASGKGPGA